MKNKGFTLVEVMVVISVIALLAGIAIPNLLRGRRSANDAVARSTLKTISSALENYAVSNSLYPSSTDALTMAVPPYLQVNYFTGTYSGFSYSSSLTNYSYTITATPTSSSTGSTTFTISTGGILSPQ